MAKTKDPTGLSVSNAKMVRDSFRKVMLENGITQTEVAKRLKWPISRVRNAFKNDRPLMAATSADLAGAIGDLARNRIGRKAVYVANEKLHDSRRRIVVAEIFRLLGNVDLDEYECRDLIELVKKRHLL